MGGRPSSVTRRARAERERDMTRIHAVMICVIFLILVQFLLLMVAVDGWMADHVDILLPAAVVSGLCFLASCWLIRFLVARPTGPYPEKPETTVR